MPHDINSALERLETNLQNLDSARKQVESTVAASNELQREVGKYTSEVNAMCDRVRDTASHFESKSKETLQKFVRQNEILTEQVQNLVTLRDEIVKTSSEIQEVKKLLTQISEELKKSQEGQDVVLKRIDQNIAELPNKLEAATTSIIELVNASTQTLQRDIDSVLQKASTVDTKVDNILSSLSSLSNLCKNIKSDLNASTDSLSKAIEKLKKDISKSVNINRWIIIIGFFILATLIIIL